MNLFSFSLYGFNSKYIQGALSNAEFISQLGPGWKSVFYLGAEISPEIEFKLVRSGAEIRRWEDSWHPNGMFWRFSAAYEFNFNFLMIRDTDSRISPRELSSLSCWFDSGKTLHIMRDHPDHNAVILGGMWGVSSKIKSIDIHWSNSSNYSNAHGQDQLFLKNEIYPKLKRDALISDSFFSFPSSRYRFPSERQDASYVGESIGPSGEVDQVLRDKLVIYENSRFKRLLILLIFYFHKHV